jgi:hypothetical protein
MSKKKRITTSSDFSYGTLEPVTESTYFHKRKNGKRSKLALQVKQILKRPCHYNQYPVNINIIDHLDAKNFFQSKIRVNAE